jgi:hypothetical protein
LSNIYYDPPNGIHVHIPVSLRQHRDRDVFLEFLSNKSEPSLADFAKRLFLEETVLSAEISPIFELAQLALSNDLPDLAAEIGDLADAVGY